LETGIGRRTTSDFNSDKSKSARPAAPLDRRALLQLAATGITIVGTGQMRTAHTEIWEEGDEQCRVQQAEASSLPDLDEVQLTDFISVSEALTGQRPLRKRLAAQYLERFARTPDYYPKLKRHLEVHKQYAVGGGTPDDIADQIMGNKEPDADDIRAAAEQVIYLWHVSAFFLQALKEQPPRTGPQIWIYGNSEQYEQALHMGRPQTRKFDGIVGLSNDITLGCASIGWHLFALNFDSFCPLNFVTTPRPRHCELHGDR
jgi:hypothetical protein